jgi:glycogen synthase
VRILTVGNMYPPHHLGGYELTWRSSVEHLRRAGHEVSVLTTGYRTEVPDPAFPDDPEARRELRWYWHDHGFPRVSARRMVQLERSNGRVLERALSQLRPDVVAWWAMGGMSLSLIGRVRQAGLPSVGVVGDDWMFYAPRVDAWTRRTQRLRALGRLAGRLAAVPVSLDLQDISWLFNSQATREKAQRDSGFRLSMADVAHPGIDPGLFGPAPPHDWEWRLLYVGRLDERKGVDAAIAALEHLPAAARLTVLGRGDDRFLARLREQCATLGVQDRVKFDTRARTELPAAYADADALLFPARWEEPWGLVPLEAMAVGTPVVTTATGGSAEYVRDRENALVIGAGAEPEHLAEAVRELAGDPSLRARLRSDGMATAGRYTEEGYNLAIERALERAVA